MKRRVAVLLGLLAAGLLLVLVPSHASAQCSPAWAPNVSYSISAAVSYGGRNYRCQQAHTSLVGWEPPNTPALWVDLGACSGGTATPTPPPRVTTTPVPTSTPRVTATPRPRATATATPTNPPSGTPTPC